MSEANQADLGLTSLSYFNRLWSVVLSLVVSYLVLVWLGQVDSGPKWKSSIKEMGEGSDWLVCMYMLAGKSFSMSKNWLALRGTVFLAQQGRRYQHIRIETHMPQIVSLFSKGDSLLSHQTSA